MNDLNSIIVEGNLTRDPVLSTTPNGVSVCNFSIGSHHMYKKEAKQHTETSFFDVEVWSRLGENCAEYLRKGRGVRVVGRLKQDRWKDGEGKSRSRLKIVAEHVEFRTMKRKAQEDETERDDAGEREGIVVSDPVPAGDPHPSVARVNQATEELSVL
ncbi:MAG: single-stranded DNA-binding protein [Spirochaetales bacterium]|nr:single-stranded DNA-binding protein [Spirochaetales bacterium]